MGLCRKKDVRNRRVREEEERETNQEVVGQYNSRSQGDGTVEGRT